MPRTPFEAAFGTTFEAEFGTAFESVSTMRFWGRIWHYIWGRVRYNIWGRVWYNNWTSARYSIWVLVHYEILRPYLALHLRTCSYNIRGRIWYNNWGSARNIWGRARYLGTTVASVGGHCANHAVKFSAMFAERQERGKRRTASKRAPWSCLRFVSLAWLTIRWCWVDVAVAIVVVVSVTKLAIFRLSSRWQHFTKT